MPPNIQSEHKVVGGSETQTKIPRHQQHSHQPPHSILRLGGPECVLDEGVLPASQRPDGKQSSGFWGTSVFVTVGLGSGLGHCSAKPRQVADRKAQTEGHMI